MQVIVVLRMGLTFPTEMIVRKNARLLSKFVFSCSFRCRGWFQIHQVQLNLFRFVGGKEARREWSLKASSRHDLIVQAFHIVLTLSVLATLVIDMAKIVECQTFEKRIRFIVGNLTVRGVLPVNSQKQIVEFA